MLRRIRSTSGWWPPYGVVLVALGLVVGLVPGVPRIELVPSVILGFFVPALVFEGALNLDLAALRKVIRPVAMLATVGVVMSIALVAALTHAVLGLDWPAALLLGAILSPTDPIAVVAVIRRSGAPPLLAALLEGESLFNDGTGVAAFTALLAASASGQFSVAGAGLRFVLVAVIGAAIGAAIGLAGAALVRRTTNSVLEVGLTLIVAYGSYAVASVVASAGVMAVVAAGVAMARVGHWGSDTERSWARIVIVLNVALFTLIGIGLPAKAVLGSAAAVAFGFAILLGTRLVPVYVLGFGIPHRWRQLMWWGGVRGALSVALALAATGQPGVNRSVPVLAYGIVAVSLVLQGALIRPAVRLLPL
jgi:monovalent cation:H+ antiporter, CPA1 family